MVDRADVAARRDAIRHARGQRAARLRGLFRLGVDLVALGVGQRRPECGDILPLFPCVLVFGQCLLGRRGARIALRRAIWAHRRRPYARTGVRRGLLVERVQRAQRTARAERDTKHEQQARAGHHGTADAVDPSAARAHVAARTAGSAHRDLSLHGLLGVVRRVYPFRRANNNPRHACRGLSGRYGVHVHARNQMANSTLNSQQPSMPPKIGATTGIHASFQRDDPLCGIGRI